MNTTFIINGGAGRVVTSIPALEKYEKLNPKDDFKIVVHGFEQLFWSHPTLQKRTFSVHQKGLFDFCIKNNKIISPEPYQLNDFYNQKCNLVEAFDQCINKTKNHSDLNYQCLHLSTLEKNKIKEMSFFFKQEKKKKKVVVFQPYGSTVELINNIPVDRSNRSLNIKDHLELVNFLSKDSVVIYISPPQFKYPHDNISISVDDHQPYLRTMMGFISECDYYIGVCSVGQHMARCFNKKGLILMGATNEKNFSYPDHFNIYRKKNRQPVYTPWRLSEGDCFFADRENDGIMDFDDNELKEILSIIKNNGDSDLKHEFAKNAFVGINYE